MFDWNDEELSNIIWGEAGESDDHIVPYRDSSEDYRNKKEWSQETATNKPPEQKSPGPKVDIHGRKVESSSKLNTNEGISPSGFGVGSWSDLSLSNTAKTDQDSMGTEVSNLVEITKYSSRTGAETKDPEVFQNTNEGKEQGDFVDYSWANIGSFDDLDRIFSNDVPIFGNVSLGSADELWSSSKDVTNSPVKPFPASADSSSLGLGTLRSTSQNLEIKTDYEQQDNLSFTLSYGKMDHPAPHLLRNLEYPGDRSRSIVKEQTDRGTGGKTSASKSGPIVGKLPNLNEWADKAYRQKKPFKFQKKSEEVGHANLLQDLYDNWTTSGNSLGQYESHLASSMVKSPPLSILSEQKQLQGSDTLQYQHVSNPFVAPSTYGNLTNAYPTMPVLANIQSGEFKNQPLPSSYDISPAKVNSINRSREASGKPLTMTPQEKIEKLRRRQQMQALLAIQKQQKQFSNRVPCVDHSLSQKCAQENQIQHVEGADIEELSNLPSFDPNSPVEQDDSNTIFVAIDDYSVEDTVLYQLQDIISKLDVRIRLCIRDSLFRLAQSAMQRHYASDTSSTNKSSRDENEVAKEETKNHNRISDAETETNPIDRTVAHLLFHRPLELSVKHPGTPESPASTKLPCERKTVGLTNMPTGWMPESSKVKQNIPHQESKSPCPLTEPQHVDQFKNSPCIDTSENASNHGPAECVATEVDASQ